jgi:hypothetical protein
MDSPGKFGIGQGGPEAPTPSPAEGQPRAPEIPAEAQPELPKEAKRSPKIPEMEIEPPPITGAPAPTVEAQPEVEQPTVISEADITAGEINLAEAAHLQEEFNQANR